MIDYLIGNPYLLVTGLIVSFVISYKTVQRCNELYDHEDVNRRKLGALKTVLAVAPFIGLCLLIFMISTL